MKARCDNYILSIAAVMMVVSGLTLILMKSTYALNTDIINNESISSKTNQSDVDLSNVNITMSRGPCHGICPVYYLEIDGDGKVIYRGYEHVNVTGEKTTQVDININCESRRDLN